MPSVSGTIEKMLVSDDDPVQYRLPLSGEAVAMNSLLGQTVRLEHDGTINCIACGRQTKKSFSQGFCYPCSQRLARCDLCIVRPEKCHYDNGTCREPQWGEEHCMREHYVYLANTSGLKVGITRGTQIPTRWIDQGANEALPMARVATRLQAGLLEVACKDHVADRTDWRRMLKGDAQPMDMVQRRVDLAAQVSDALLELRERFGEENIEMLADTTVRRFNYPVQQYPTKVSALNLDKAPLIEGVVHGIKGQYLILDHGVLNVRKFSGYRLTVSW